VSTIDHQFIEFVVKSLVSKPDAVKVERTIDEKGVLLELTVDPEDLGRVIGKRGATAQSIRTLLRALGTKNDARYNLKIVDNGTPRPERAKSGEDKSQPDEKPKDKGEEDSKDAKKEDENEDKFASFSEKSDFASDEPAEKPAEASGEESGDDQDDDVVAKTRRELADLDDLDV
jgi:hypothetical protein